MNIINVALLTTVLTATLFARPLHGTLPCGTADWPCWSRQARIYTNQIRQKHGVRKPLRDGLQPQLRNARGHAEHLARVGDLQHQLLAAATHAVGCGRWIGGENVAYNYDKDADFAKACVNQWAKSKPHLKNILRHWFDEVSIGFHATADGRVFCVQTFAAVSAHAQHEVDKHKSCVPILKANVIDDSQGGGNAQAKTWPTPAHGGTPKMVVHSTPTPNVNRKPVPSPAPSRRPTAGEQNRESSLTDTGEEYDEGDYDDEHRFQDGEGDEVVLQERKNLFAAKRSCRCLQVSEQCWSSLGEFSGGRCIPFTAAFHQPMECRNLCCEFCHRFTNHILCTNPMVTFICLMALHA